MRELHFFPKNFNPISFQNFIPSFKKILITFHNKLHGSSHVKIPKKETAAPISEQKIEIKEGDSKLDEKSIAWKNEAEEFINGKWETVIDHGYTLQKYVSNSSEIPDQMNVILKEISACISNATKILANFKQLNANDQQKLKSVKKELEASIKRISKAEEKIKKINETTVEALQKVESDFQTGNLGFKAIRDSQTKLQGIQSPFQNFVLKKIEALENQLNLMDRFANYNLELPKKEHIKYAENGNPLPFIKNVLHKLNLHYTQARERSQFWNLPRIKSRAVAVIDLFSSKLNPTQKRELINFLSNDQLFIHHHQSISFFRKTDTWSTLNKSLREPPQSSCEKFRRFIGF